MKRVCAWCEREIGTSEHNENLPITHGLCQVCRGRFFTLTKHLHPSDASTVKEPPPEPPGTKPPYRNDDSD